MNVVCLGGNIGADPELKMTTNGRANLRFSLATSKRWKDQSGEQQERTEWHKIVIWGKRAEGLANHLGKGQKLCVTGELQYGQYEDREGVTRYTTTIVVSDVTFMGARPGGSSGGGGGGGGYGQRQQPAPTQQDGNTGFGDDDDIPF